VLKNYLKNGFHGQMKYMEDHFEMRLNPTSLFEGTKSVISVLLNYYTQEKQSDENAPILSKYAYGKDYHLVLKQKLHELLIFIQKIAGKVNARAFVDSAPILEKAWAQRAGLGWISKNGNLLNKKLGSFFFIGELLVDFELDYNEEVTTDFCGQCTRCIDACPTKAIVSPGIVNGSKCISYLTIELKDDIPVEFAGKMQNRVFGCDICQDVCPFNKKAKENGVDDFKPQAQIMQMTTEEWYNMDKVLFEKLFKNSALKRTKFEGLKGNLDFLKISLAKGK
jgi:epoxyqueuosine reductase